MALTEGLCYVTATSKDQSKLSNTKLNEFYDNEHVPDILRYGFSKLALRYKNSNPASQSTYLALYPQDDVTNISSPATATMMEEIRHSKVLGGQDHHTLINYGIGAWSKIQAFKGYGHASISGEERGQTLVAVFIEPADDAELDAWYRKQHLDMLSMCQGYRQTTRYQRDEAPRFLALHEYACSADKLPVEQIQQVRETEWSREVLSTAKVFEREVWELIGVQGEKGMKS